MKFTTLPCKWYTSVEYSDFRLSIIKRLNLDVMFIDGLDRIGIEYVNWY